MKKILIAAFGAALAFSAPMASANPWSGFADAVAGAFGSADGGAGGIGMIAGGASVSTSEQWSNTSTGANAPGPDWAHADSGSSNYQASIGGAASGGFFGAYGASSGAGGTTSAGSFAGACRNGGC